MSLRIFDFSMIWYFKAFYQLFGGFYMCELSIVVLCLFFCWGIGSFPHCLAKVLCILRIISFCHMSCICFSHLSVACPLLWEAYSAGSTNKDTRAELSGFTAQLRNYLISLFISFLSLNWDNSAISLICQYLERCLAYNVQSVNTSFINHKFIFKYSVLYCTDFIVVFHLFLWGWRDEEGGRIKGRKKMLESIPLALCDSFVKNKRYFSNSRFDFHPKYM